MKDELLKRICDNCIVRSHFNLSVDEFSEIINSHDEGKRKLLEMWEKAHKEDNFPPKDETELGYYYTLMARGIITDLQYSKLREEL